MKNLICKYCKTEIKIDNVKSIIMCPHCCKVQSFPSTMSENDKNSYINAIHLWKDEKYNDSINVLNKLLETYPNDPDLNWLIFLNVNEIQYLDNGNYKMKGDNKKSIKQSKEYINAITNSSSEKKVIFEEIANLICDNKEDVSANVKNDNYQVYLCCKQTDDDGNDTYEYEIAQELLNKLYASNIKTFYDFCDPDKLFDPRFEAKRKMALNSASVLIVFGSQTAGFFQGETKDTWFTYYQMMNEGKNRNIILCSNNSKKTSLPDELMPFNVLNYYKKGIVKQILLEAQKYVYISEEEINNASKLEKYNSSTNTTTSTKEEELTKNAQDLLLNNEFDAAKKCAIELIELNKENYYGYLLGLFTDLKVRNFDELTNLKNTFESNEYYQKILEIPNDALRGRLQGINNIIKSRIDAANNPKRKKKKLGKLGRILITLLIVFAIIAGIVFSIIQFAVPYVKYITGVSYYNSGENLEAYNLLSTLKIKDSQELAEEIKSKTVSLWNVGDIVEIGEYSQRGASLQPIKWKIIGSSDGKYFLLCENGLIFKPYNDTFIEVEWKDSTLRNWLNTEFLNSSFTEEEKALLVNVSDAWDEYVTLLSREMCELYLQNPQDRLCSPINNLNYENMYSNWWLKDSGYDGYGASFINQDGVISIYGDGVSSKFNCVRPLIVINVEG